MNILQVLLVSILSVVVLFVVTKLMGNKQISQMNLFDYIVGITMGSIAADMATNLENPLQPATAMVTYAVFAVLSSVITNKSNRLREFISGKPLILMEKNKIYRSRLKKARLDINEFLTTARLAGYFDITQVDTAIFEHNGDISFLPKTPYRPATPGDLRLSVQNAAQSVNIIVDGKIMPGELAAMGKDRIWLQNRLTEAGYRQASDILLATLDAAGTLSLYAIDT